MLLLGGRSGFFANIEIFVSDFARRLRDNPGGCSVAFLGQGERSMSEDPKTTLSMLTGEAILTDAFDRLSPRLVAMIGRRISTKLAARIDPEGVVQEAFVRARPRWQMRTTKPDELNAWVYGQVLDRLREVVRGAMGPEHDVDRGLAWPDGSAAPLAEKLIDSRTGPSTALSRAERCDMVRTALMKLDPIDREILALRYFDGLDFAQIGVLLGLKENTANTRALRAAVKFRRLIPQAFRPPGADRP
jgi:RNA polymerase sigma-70 factor (ECF subfamily)